MAKADQHRPPAPREVPPLEWVVAGIGALLVLGTIGYLAAQALWRDTTPPDVRLVAEPARELEGGWLVRFRALNQGGEPAAELLIEGELRGPDGSVETAEATLDYLPPGSQREGGLFFSRDPGQFELALRAKGYARP
jgi:uncharacterized protein (TIGR02588 family)